MSSLAPECSRCADYIATLRAELERVYSELARRGNEVLRWHTEATEARAEIARLRAATSTNASMMACEPQCASYKFRWREGGMERRPCDCRPVDGGQKASEAGPHPKRRGNEVLRWHDAYLEEKAVRVARDVEIARLRGRWRCSACGDDVQVQPCCVHCGRECGRMADGGQKASEAQQSRPAPEAPRKGPQSETMGCPRRRERE